MYHIGIEPVKSDKHNGAGGEMHRYGERRENDAAENGAEVPVIGQLVVKLNG